MSPDEKDGGVWINQDARFALTKLEADKEISYIPRFKGNGMYIFVIDGKVEAGDQLLSKRDATGIYETDNLTIKANEDSELLLIEVPMVWSRE